jgi:hypothetical protein
VVDVRPGGRLCGVVYVGIIRGSREARLFGYGEEQVHAQHTQSVQGPGSPGRWHRSPPGWSMSSPAWAVSTAMITPTIGVLTVADLADDGFVEDADRFSLFLRQRDGLVGRVTVVRHE